MKRPIFYLAAYIDNNISLLNGSKGRAQEGRLVQLRLTAVDSRRNPSFSSDEFLTASQIAGFSSRLASKKTLPGEGDHVEALVGTADFVLPIV